LRVRVKTYERVKPPGLEKYLFPTFLSEWCLPGLGPAIELVAWRGPIGTTFVDSVKGPKTIDAPFDVIK